MKIVNWILKALTFIKDSAELIKWIVIAVLAISTFTGFKSCRKEKAEKNDVVNILTSKVESFKTESGLNAIQADNWIIKAKSLEKINGEISQENT